MSIENIWNKLRDLNDNGVLDTLMLLGGKLIWVDGANGNDANYGTKNSPVKTLEVAFAKATAGKHDVIVIKSSGGTIATSSVYVNAAFDWNKACTHLVAQSPVNPIFGPRARLCPTPTTTAFAAFFTVSVRNCLFHNISFVTEFDTGIDGSIPLTVTAPYNRFYRCQLAGMIDAASAAGSSSRCLKISGASENLFEECVIGVDTIPRSTANASIQFLSGSGRNIFKKCIFPIRATATSPLLVLTAASSAMDRFNLFEDCVIWNHGTSTIAGLCTLAASSGGYLAFVRPSVFRSITGFGTDATSRGQIYITGPTDGSTVSGVGYNPNA